jgi:hypothetical protein
MQGFILLFSGKPLPAMNGRDLAKLLLALHPGHNCLFMSGYTAGVIVTEGAPDKGLNTINKPFTLKELSTNTPQGGISAFRRLFSCFFVRK